MAKSPLMRLVRRLSAAALAQNPVAPLAPVRRAGPSNPARRRLLAAGAAGAFGAGLIGAPRPASGSDALEVDVVVLGGGIAGLNAAWTLKQAGVTALVLEGSNRLGGRIFSRSGALAPGLVTEFGAEFINSDHADMLALVEQFRLPLFDRRTDVGRSPAPETAFYLGEAAVDEATLVPWLAGIAGQITQDAARLEADFIAVAPEFDVLSVTEYLDTHAGLIPQPIVRRLLEASIRTEFGVEPERSSALQLLFNAPSVEARDATIIAADEIFTIVGGNSRLIGAMADAVQPHVRLRSPVRAISGNPEAGYRIEVAGGQPVEARFVVCALPLPVVRSLALDIEMAPELRRFIDTVNLGQNEKLLVGFDARAWRSPEGFSGEAWRDGPYAGAWDAGQRQGDAPGGALTFFLGGRQVDVLRDRPRRLAAQSFVADLGQFIPTLSAAASGVSAATNWGVSRFTRGSYTSFAPGEITGHAFQSWVEGEGPDTGSEVAAGGVYFVGEHTSDEFYGYMNGGAETGRLAAQAILDRLGRAAE